MSQCLTNSKTGLVLTVAGLLFFGVASWSFGDTILPSSGLGKFEAEVVGDELTVQLLVHYSFLSGDPESIAGFPMNEYHWNRSAEKEFRENFARRVEKEWTGRFRLRKGKKRLSVKVVVKEVNAEDAHWHLLVEHYPDEAVGWQASVCQTGHAHSGDGCATNPGLSWGTARLASTDLYRAYVLDPEIGRMRIRFVLGSDELAGESKRFALSPVVQLAKKLKWRLQLTGYAHRDEVSPIEEYGLLEPAMELAQARTLKVVEQLRTARVDVDRIHVFSAGETEEDTGRFVDLEVHDPRKAMDVLAHEAGHMLGLDDEAKLDCWGNSSELPGHDYSAMVYQATGEFPVLANDEGIMSRGRRVEKRHYAPFVEALEFLGQGDGWEIVDP